MTDEQHSTLLLRGCLQLIGYEVSELNRQDFLQRPFQLQLLLVLNFFLLVLLQKRSIEEMDAFTPQQTIELVSRIGTKKAHMRLDKLFANSLMTGPLLGFGCAVLVSTNAAPWYQENAPGLIRTFGALLFPVGEES